MATFSKEQPPRRQYSPQFKARIVAACRQPGASISRIAHEQGLNANMVRRWVKQSPSVEAKTVPAFVPVSLPTPSTAVDSGSTIIRLQIPYADGSIVVEWPTEQASQCLAWLRELLP